jgi:23S rRNA pseudouridine1911/1915/1917 synthase
LRQEIFVGEDGTDDRIDKFLAEQCEELSRSFLQKLLKSGEVSVNGQAVKASFRLSEGDLIVFEVPEAAKPEILPEPIPLDILYEDEDVILINKPKGMVVHPAAGHYSGTLVNALMYHCRDSLSGINGVLRPGIVHRIDMDTTGVIIACKNDVSHRSIAEQLKEHSITRRYQAIVHGRLKTDEGTVDAPIGRNPQDRKKMSINDRNGKPAVTHYHVLNRFRDYTHIECRLETGRTHQIRVHMASIGHPLLGDVVYGPARCPYRLEGQTLHAGVLGFVHPRSGEYMEFSAPLPEYFEKLLRTLPRE